MGNGTNAAMAVLDGVRVQGKSLIDAINKPGTTPVAGWPKGHSSLHEFGIELRDRIAGAIDISRADGVEGERNRIALEFRKIVQEELPEPIRMAMLRIAKFLEGEVKGG